MPILDSRDPCRHRKVPAAGIDSYAQAIRDKVYADVPVGRKLSGLNRRCALWSSCGSMSSPVLTG